jgi:Mn-containing catalase
MGLDWEYISDPVSEVIQTEGLSVLDDEKETEIKESEELNKELSAQRSAEVKQAEPDGVAQWSDYTAQDSE